MLGAPPVFVAPFHLGSWCFVLYSLGHSFGTSFYIYPTILLYLYIKKIIYVGECSVLRKFFSRPLFVYLLFLSKSSTLTAYLFFFFLKKNK